MQHRATLASWASSQSWNTPRYPDPTLSPMGSTSRQWLVGEDFRIRTADATPSLAHEIPGDSVPLHVKTPARYMGYP
ncbi:uncharacterized protein N7469_004081 [Penicillium citrinum]|uniref:Uncharacterized protein n=2 Tax=Penicillium TaxID=5073 RepID=A0A9W9P6E0_PENCI|nr:uncharacterized protein N7469_004081 [Penicillium citrinum]KAJ5234913.1 hypothetical protein N7469_004081 [Penicillium citrinum]KAJ5590534.1 hypothetical protein N7450_004506 [Penicillium hetheringtonii]KAK5800620.1 hypothetical protein VI817_002832 [Penicillium citrinum]